MSTNHEKFKQLLPHKGFTTLIPHDFKEMMKIIHEEPDKDLKDRYFSYVLDKLFAYKWGWYRRLEEILSALPEYDDEYADQLPEKTRVDALKVLKMVRKMHIELNYPSDHIMLIDRYIRNISKPKDDIKRTATEFEHAKKHAKLPSKLKNYTRGAKKVGSDLPRSLDEITSETFVQNMQNMQNMR